MAAHAAGCIPRDLQGHRARPLHLLRDGLIADQHGVDPEAAYRLLQQLRR